MNTSNAPAFNVSPLKEMVRSAAFKAAVANLHMTRKVAKETRAKVDAYIAPIFAKYTFPVRAEWAERAGQTVAEPNKLYLCSDEALCAQYYADCDAEHRRQGYDLKPGYCPASMAEAAAIDAENTLIKLAASKLDPVLAKVYGPAREKLIAILTNTPE